MNCKEVLEKILLSMKDEDIAVFNLGLISRIAHSVKDRKGNFYMLGSMGLVSSVGLGIALNCDKKVFIFDGDGSLLMDMGIMAMIGSLKCKNLIHLVFDNQVYCSTGNQPTFAEYVDLASIAENNNYNKIVRVGSMDECKDFIKNMHTLEEPVFCSLKVDKENISDFPRVFLSPLDVTKRFKNFVCPGVNQ